MRPSQVHLNKGGTDMAIMVNEGLLNIPKPLGLELLY